MNRMILLYMTLVGIAAAQGSVSSTEAATVKGKILFTKIGCYECHGYVGQGGRAGARIAGLPLRREDLIRYVRHPPGEMPAYTIKVVSDEELGDIYAYIQSLPPPKPVTDIPLLDAIKRRQ